MVTMWLHLLTARRTGTVIFDCGRVTVSNESDDEVDEVDRMVK